jgi:hypothetical protein
MVYDIPNKVWFEKLIPLILRLMNQKVETVEQKMIRDKMISLHSALEDLLNIL